MRIINFIALRYIFGKRSLNIITVITFISILGITTGVAVIIVVMSVFNGFRDFTENQMLMIDPHVRIIPADGNQLSFDPKLIDFLEHSDEIINYSPLINERTAIMKDGKMLIAEIVAVDSSHKDYLRDFASSTLIGRFDFLEDNSTKGVIVGAGIAENLSLYYGDTISFVSPELIELSIRTFRRAKPINAIVTGIFQTNVPKYDQNIVISSNSILKGLVTKQIYANYIDIKIQNPYNHSKIQQSIENIFKSYKTLSWKDLNIELYNVMKLEQMVAFIILSIIILIAVFNVLASLTMSVIDKKSDIGILKVLGATNDSIKLIFRNVGLFSGIISTIAGTIIGLAFCYGQINFKWIKVDTSKFLIDAIPIKVDYYYVIIVVLFSLVLSALATIYPSKRAAGMNIINSIRND